MTQLGPPGVGEERGGTLTLGYGVPALGRISHSEDEAGAAGLTLYILAENLGVGPWDLAQASLLRGDHRQWTGHRAERATDSR